VRKLTLPFPLVVSIMMSAAATVRSAPIAPIQRVLSNPLSCPNTNYLSRSAGFAEAATTFTCDGKASPFRRDAELSAQAPFGLGGGPDERKFLPSGLFLFAASRAHECFGQAAAVVLDKHGIVKTVGFSSFRGCFRILMQTMGSKGERLLIYCGEFVER
jgi:hypothetical protein